MAKPAYSIDLCHELVRLSRDQNVDRASRPAPYDRGDVIEISFTTVWPEHRGKGRFRIESFAGGGFAGQVYRCVVEEVSFDGPSEELPFAANDTLAVKMMLPASGFSRWFRNLVYWIAFQGPFSAQVNEAACKAGLLWQRLARRATGVTMDDEDAVADVYASFFDTRLQAWGEIREWVAGRVWRLEPDVTPGLRRKWRTLEPSQTGSPEYVAKRRFMADFVTLLHDMGAPELARQYEWWTMKSQPNVLKRDGAARDPASGLCAVDFRAGLALVPFLPMSPADLKLIARGLAHGVFAQFDRCDMDQLHDFCESHADRLADVAPMVDALADYDHAYRRSLPDITHHGLRLLVDGELRKDVRAGLRDGYRAAGLVTEAFGDDLPEHGARFTVFYLLGAIPVLGRFARRLWGNRSYRSHVRKALDSRDYLRRTVRAGVAERLAKWHRAGRVGERRARHLADHPGRFWSERCTLGLLPPGLHRFLSDPRWVGSRLQAAFVFMKSFYRDADYREQWLRDQVDQGHKDGMLDEDEHRRIMQHVRDPFIVKYLKCLAVHFATLPVTQIVSVLVGGVAAAWILVKGGSGTAAAGAFAAVIVVFQFIPISPGSICRGAYVVYLMIMERNFRDYMVAAPLSFVKYIGYLAFPLQMVTTYPELARFMASRWATGAVHIVPVFGEGGALLEHAVFDAFFNRPRIIGRWAARRMGLLTTIWMMTGISLLVIAGAMGMDWTRKSGVNLAIAVLCLCVLPRLLFYPVLRRKKRLAQSGSGD